MYIDFSPYNYISFDVFDTLLLRGVGEPKDVFYYVGQKLDVLNFRELRAKAEREERLAKKEKTGNYEVSFRQIWDRLANMIGCNPQEGMRLEIEAEKNLCYANPMMLKVWNRLKEMGKKIIVISDMYLPSEVIRNLIEGVGFTGADKIYVSCEHDRNKGTGTLFQLVAGELGGKSVIHIGDNPKSDDEMARKNGFASCPYRNVNRNMLLYRPYDMSYLVDRAYRGIVSGHLYSGDAVYSPEYEYGHLYGGLFVTGYCAFIHEYVKRIEAECGGKCSAIFLSRDGDILKKVYDRLYPGEDTAYAYWSRKAATIVGACLDKEDFFRRFLVHKCGQGYSIREVLASMKLEWMEKSINEFGIIHMGDEMTTKNMPDLKAYISAHWDEVLKSYEDDVNAAGEYYRNLTGGCSRAVAIDIGWAGSGAMMLRRLFKEVWKLPCELTGMIAGTNTIHNAEADTSEAFLQSRVLLPYLYAQQFNRDLLKLHNPGKDYNVFWELLLSSDTRQFNGFGFNTDGNVLFEFGEMDANIEGIREIQRGIIDFATEYQERFKAYPYMMNISGRDAYAPMIVAASDGEKYLKWMKSRFALEKNVV